MKARYLALLLGVASLCGCQGGGAGAEVPARLVAPSAESRAELAEVVSRALNSDTITLSADALTTDSRLIIEHKARYDLEHGRIPGRDMGQPEQFRLVKRGEHCILLHAGAGERWELTQSRCAPE